MYTMAGAKSSVNYELGRYFAKWVKENTKIEGLLLILLVLLLLLLLVVIILMIIMMVVKMIITSMIKW